MVRNYDTSNALDWTGDQIIKLFGRLPARYVSEVSLVGFDDRCDLMCSH